MITRFDHVVLAVDDLRSVSDRVFGRLGLSVQPGGRHTGFGTENAVVRFASDYIQVAAVYDRDAAASTSIRRRPMLDLLATRRGGWLAYAMATDDIDALAEHFRQAGLDADGPYSMRRERPDGHVLKWRLLQPGGTALRRPWPFFIQWDGSDQSADAFESPSIHELGARRVSGVTIIVRELEAAQYLYGEQLGFRPGDTPTHDAPGTSVTRYWLGPFCVDLVAPTAPGPVMDLLLRHGEGVYEVRLAMADYKTALELLARRDVEIDTRFEDSAGLYVQAIEDFGAHLRIEQDRMPVAPC